MVPVFLYRPEEFKKINKAIIEATVIAIIVIIVALLIST